MGRVLSDIAPREALHEKSLIAFQKTVLTAVQEGEGACIRTLLISSRRVILSKRQFA